MEGTSDGSGAEDNLRVQEPTGDSLRHGMPPGVLPGQALMDIDEPIPCLICKMLLNGRSQYEDHLEGRRHRKKKRAQRGESRAVPGNNEDDDDHAPKEKNNKLKKIKSKPDRKRPRKEEQEELENVSELDMTERPKAAYLTASSVRFVFLCGVAYLLMTVWRADAKETLLQQVERDGELLDIPGWRLATAQRVPTEIAERLKKSFCGLVIALLEGY